MSFNKYIWLSNCDLPKTFLCAPSELTPSLYSQPPETSGLSSVLILLPFLHCLLNGITQYVAFHVFFFSLSIVLLRFTQIS